MRKMAAGLAITAVLSALPAGAYSGRWLVVEDLDSRTCYRVTALPQGDNWRKLGVFNTFREAGMWTWEHRGGLCRYSPVFS